MGKRRSRKWGSLGLSALLLGGTFLPGLAGGVKAAQFGSVVISEVYGGGGNSGATLKNDFIELYNPTDQDISVEGWSVQYASSTKGFSTSLSSSNSTNLTGVVKAHGYYLIQEKAGSGGTVDLDAPDAIGGINMSGTAGKVALVKSDAAISGKDDANVVDFVGFGGANEYEGSAATDAPSNTTSVERKANDGSDPTTDGVDKGNGWDENNNSTDFVKATPNPQNSTSPIEPEIVLPPAPPAEGVSYIKDVRANESDGQPSMIDKDVVVEGIATVANNVIGSKTFYIQDATGGVNVFGSSDAVEAGSKVRVSGKVVFFNGLTEISASKVEAVQTSEKVTAREISIAELNNYNTAEPAEGTLVSLKGKVTNVPATPYKGATNVTITDETGKATTIRVMDSTGIVAVDTFTQDHSYSVTGIVGQYDTTSPYDSGYQIFPRSTADVAEYFALSLTHNPFTVAYTGNDVSFNAIADGADTVTAYYKGTSETSYHELQLAKGEQNVYTAVLPWAEVPVSGFSYYIQAVNKSETKTVGSAEKPYDVQVKDDTAGPELSGLQPSDQSIVELNYGILVFK